MKKITYSIGALATGGLIWLLVIFMSRPDLQKIKESTTDNQHPVQSPDPVTYAEIIKQEQERHNSFLLGKASTAKIFDNTFPYSSKKLDAQKTHAVLAILNDSTSYIWGELTTMRWREKTIVYYDQDNNAVGYTLLSFEGQLNNHPYHPVMKEELLSESGIDRLASEIEYDHYLNY